MSLNEIYEKQLNEFTDERQQECIRLHKKINDIDEITKEDQQLIEKAGSLEYIINGNIKKIEQLNSMIPKQKLVTNYKIKPKIENKTCAEQHRML